MRRTLVPPLLALLLLSLAPRPSSGQRVEELDLPRSVAQEVIDFFNDSSTIRLQGRAEIPAGRIVDGNLAVLRGPVEVAGEIRGNLVVVNGDLEVLDGARISGDVTVLGGRATVPLETTRGRVTVYDESLRYTARGQRIAMDEGRREDDRGFQLEGRRTRSRLSVRVEDSYNRVEGLPVRFGPVLETLGRNYTRVDALGIWRTDQGLRLDTEDMGWILRAEQHLGPFTLGATAHSLVAPVESWQLRDIEASLASFLFHRDYRDHYDREGWAAFVRWEDLFSGTSLSVEYRDEEHAFAPVGSPWTIKRNDAPWRPQPLAGEGRLRSVVAQARIDQRNDPEDPTDGWYLDLSAQLGVGGDLVLPGFLEPEPLPATVAEAATSLGSAFRSGFLDLRRYARVTPGSDLRIRGVLAGSLDGEPLPPQMQRALGGEGSLPGYGLFQADCGARGRPFSVIRTVEEESIRTPVFAAYGCDRVALVQLEYRQDFSVGFDLGPEEDEWDDDWEWYPVVDFSPSLAFSLNAGRGWSLADQTLGGPLREDTGTLVDVGVGFYLGDLGLYWAWPLNDSSRGVNFYLRIDHRF